MFQSQPEPYTSNTSTPKERSYKSVFEKYNIPEARTIKTKTNRVSIQSKLSNSQRGAERKDPGMKLKYSEMQKSGNTVKKGDSEECIRKQLDKWGFVRTESREISNKMFAKKPTSGKEGTELNELNSQFDRLRSSDFRLPQTGGRRPELKRKTLPSSMKWPSKKGDILDKYGIAQIKTSKKTSAANSKDPSENNDHIFQKKKGPEGGGSLMEGSEGWKGIMGEEFGDDSLKLDSKLPKELDKQFKKMMLMEIGRANQTSKSRRTTMRSKCSGSCPPTWGGTVWT